MQPIYLDYNATTPVDPCVIDAMPPYLREHFNEIINWRDAIVAMSRAHVSRVSICCPTATSRIERKLHHSVKLSEIISSSSPRAFQDIPHD